MPEDSSLEEQVQKVIEEDIRPFLVMDGGNIEYLGIEEGYVKLQLVGACAGCPGAAMTLQMGVERLLREKVPGIKGVIPVST